MSDVNQIALEFARFVLQDQPADADFLKIYDAMSRAATGRTFRNLGHQELAQLGISFSLLGTQDLEILINEARKSLTATLPPRQARIRPRATLDQ